VEIQQFADGDGGGTSVIVAFLPADPGSLAAPEGDPPDELHVTCCYLTADASQIPPDVLDGIKATLAEVATMGPPIDTVVAAVAQFRPGEDGTAATALVLEADDLVYAHDLIEDALSEVWDVPDDIQYPTWIPHLTRGYSAPLEPLTSDLTPDVFGMTVTLDRIALWAGPDRTEWPMGGAPTAAGEPVSDTPADPAVTPPPTGVAASTPPSLRLVASTEDEDQEEASITVPGFVIRSHPSAGFYAEPAPALHAVKES
jgi:hypothetical protein